MQWTFAERNLRPASTKSQTQNNLNWLRGYDVLRRILQIDNKIRAAVKSKLTGEIPGTFSFMRHYTDRR